MASFQTSQSTTQANIDGDLRYTDRQTIADLDLIGTLVVRDRTDSTRRLQAGLIVDETLSGGFFLEALGQLSTNQELNLLQRYLVGAGLGRYVIRTNRSILSGYAGGAFPLERYAGESRRNNAEALLGVNTQILRLYHPELDISGDFKLWPSLTTSGRFRIDANAKARAEIYKDVFV